MRKTASTIPLIEAIIKMPLAREKFYFTKNVTKNFEILFCKDQNNKTILQEIFRSYFGLKEQHCTTVCTAQTGWHFFIRKNSRDTNSHKHFKVTHEPGHLVITKRQRQRRKDKEEDKEEWRRKEDNYERQRREKEKSKKGRRIGSRK